MSFPLYDIGAVNHSPLKIKSVLPGCEYHSLASERGCVNS